MKVVAVGACQAVGPLNSDTVGVVVGTRNLSTYHAFPLENRVTVIATPTGTLGSRVGLAEGVQSQARSLRREIVTVVASCANVVGICSLAVGVAVTRVAAANHAKRVGQGVARVAGQAGSVERVARLAERIELLAWASFQRNIVPVRAVLAHSVVEFGAVDVHVAGPSDHT